MGLFISIFLLLFGSLFCQFSFFLLLPSGIMPMLDGIIRMFAGIMPMLDGIIRMFAGIMPMLGGIIQMFAGIIQMIAGIIQMFIRKMFSSVRLRTAANCQKLEWMKEMGNGAAQAGNVDGAWVLLRCKQI